MVWRAPILVAALVQLAACSTPSTLQRVKVPEEPPETLEGQGLLVATIAGNHLAASTFEKLGFSMASVEIGGAYYTNAVRENVLVLPLKPGNYVLESLDLLRNVNDRTETRYPLQFPFQVLDGQATNLGVVALVGQVGQPGKFWKVLVDNTSDVNAYLRARYPKLAAGLRPATPILASENKYADAKLLETLRRDIARDSWLTSEDPGTAQYVGGEVGTIARLLRDSHDRVAAFDVLDSGTTSAMLSCSGDAARFVCSSAEPALYFVQGGKVERRPLSVPARHVWVHTFPPNGLVLVDEHMTIYSSNDNGANWSKYVWYARKKPLHPLASLKFANGKGGYYVYATFNLDPLTPPVLYSDYGAASYRAVDIPKLSAWERLVETPEGLLIGPQGSADKDNPAVVYLRPAGKPSWQPLELPGKRCVLLQREKTSTASLTVLCDSKLFSSKDGAHTWAEKVAAKP